MSRANIAFVLFVVCIVLAGHTSCGSSSTGVTALDFSRGQFLNDPYTDRVVKNSTHIGASVVEDPTTGEAYIFWAANRGIAGARLSADHKSIDAAMSSCDESSPPVCTRFTDPDGSVGVPGVIYDSTNALWYLFYAINTDPSNENHQKIKFATATSPLTIADGLGYTVAGTAVDDNYDPDTGYHTPAQYLNGSYGNRMVRFASSPDVLKASDGTYILYFSVHVLETEQTDGTEIGTLHVGTATASALSGPWTLQKYFLPNCGDPSILFKDEIYYLFSSALDGDSHKDAFAVSTDGFEFTDQQFIRHYEGDGTEITDRSFGDTDVYDFGTEVRAYVNDAEFDDDGELIMQGITTFTFPLVQ